MDYKVDDVRVFLAIDWVHTGDGAILRDALKGYIIDQTETLKTRCLSSNNMEWDDKIAHNIERAIALYNGIQLYTTTKSIDDNSAVIRKFI